MSKRIWYILFLWSLIPFFTQAQNSSSYWSEKTEAEITVAGNRVITPNVYRTVAVDTLALRNIIEQAPHESLSDAKNSDVILSVPMPDGTSEDFRIVLYDMMEEPLAENHPVIKTGYGISTGKNLASIRFDWTYRGFHAFIRTEKNTVFIDPYSFGDKVHYVSYFKKDYPAPETPFICHVDTPNNSTDFFADSQKSGDCVLREYRLAVATTGQYSNYFGASNASQSGLVLSAVVTTMNRVNGVYEQDVTIRMILIGNNEDIFYYSGASDPYTNSDAGAMLSENQSNIDAVIGNSNYDIGHVFGTGGGGVAWLGVPCNNNHKAKGVTGLGSPEGDPFDIDYVAHEMGHQWGANHTQNNSCNRNGPTAMEPGSASTIMGYAGICSPNVQFNSDAYFHGISVQEMNNYIAGGNGNSCDSPVFSFSNNPPTVSAGSNYTIPRLTPFVLTATGSDPDGDPITYCWEQWDNETGSMPPSASNPQGPMFRSFFPTSSPKRYFPRLDDLVNNVSPTWEVLPGVNRNMEFRVTARDLRGTVGCTDEDNMNITVNALAGPFEVTLPNLPLTWTEGQVETVTWNVAGTIDAPISCANVDILLSYDGGFTYPATLASGVPNDGSHNVTVPIGTTIQARVMVICSDNVFFDISNNNFTIEEASFPDYTISVSPIDLDVCGNSSASYTIDIGSLLGYNFPVNMSVSGVPFGASSAFSSNPVTPGSSTVLTINNLGSVPGGNYTLTITASSITGSKSEMVDMNVLPNPGSINLGMPVDNATDIALLPTLIWQTDITASLYQIQIATDPAFSNLVLNTTSLGNNYTLITELEPNTLYYWRVKGWNEHCDGNWSASRSFTTLPCRTFFSGTDVNIPTSGTASSIINVPHTGDLTNIRVENINGTHSYVGDLTFTLIAPDNSQVILMEEKCGGNDNFNLGFDDNSSLSSIPCPPTTGSIYQPQGSLATFINTSIAGDWTLRIDDNISGDGGQLNEWEFWVCATNSTLLPVELLHFKVFPLDNTIGLSWTTAMEFDNAGFEVQRKSAFEPEFSTIGWVEGKGNSELPSNYHFEDDKVTPGIVYYFRLRQLDFDGKESLSNILSASLEQNEQDYILYPNPVNQILNIQKLGNRPAGESLLLLDIRGRVLHETVLTSDQETLNLADYPSGVYILKIDDRQFRVVKD